MSRKRFRTPPTLPETTQCRGTVVPASKEWLGIYSDALLELTHAYNYEQVEPTDLTPEQTAGLAYLQYLNWLDSTCANADPCPDPEIPEVDAPIYRRNPTTGRWEYVGDNGWEEPTGENAIPTPADRPEATVPLQECGAASNAANVLKLMYQGILSVYDDQVDPALNQIEMAAQIALYGGSAFGPISASFLALTGLAWEVFTAALAEITMNSWTAAWHTKLVCILNSNVEMVNGKAHFNFFNVNKDLVGFLLPVIDGYVRVRWQVWYLLQCIGDQGLDLAGATTDVAGNCVTCDTWCVELTPQAFGFVLTNGYYNAYGEIRAVKISTQWRWNATLAVDTSACRITRVGLTWDRLGGGTTSQVVLNATPVTQTMQAYQETNYGGSPMSPDNQAIYSTGTTTTLTTYTYGLNEQNITLKKVKVVGTGINPFAVGSNC